MSFAILSKDIEKKKFSSLYFLFGEEPYYIDKLVKLIEANALNPGEESFNKSVLFGPETTIEKIFSEVRSFPMMAERRLVILKEAQRFKNFDKLLPLFENIVPSTVFVIAYKDKGPDGRLKSVKVLKSKATLLESKKVYEKEANAFVTELAASKGFKMQVGAQNLLVSYLGTNLGLIEGELEKIFLYLRGSGKTLVDDAIVYEMINLDKDFNIFELQNALGDKNHSKAHLIISQMSKNQKEYPAIVTLSGLFGFYNKLALLASKSVRDDKQIAELLGINPFFATQYKSAMRKTSQNEIHRNINFLLEADLQLKGIVPTHMGDEHVMKTLVLRLLN